MQNKLQKRKYPKITILMSVYNGEKYLREAVDSILNQTFKNFEFIIINDGSTDKTEEILKDYNDSRIKIYKNKRNLGVAKSLNVGLKMAKGEYIARQDSDDISTPKRLAVQADFLDRHPAYAVVGVFPKVINEISDKIRYGQRPIKDIDIRKTLKTKNCIVHGSAMIRMRCLHDVGLYDESMANSEDYELWLRLAKKYAFRNIAKFLYVLRLHNKNLDAAYIKEQQIFVALGKIKNNSSNIEETTEHFLNRIARYRSIPAKKFFIFKCIRTLTFNKISIYNIFRIAYKIKFSKSVRRILKDVKFKKIEFKEAKLNFEKLLDSNLLN